MQYGRTSGNVGLGGPKMPSQLKLGSASDDEPSFINEQAALRDGRGISPERLRIETAGGRSLLCPDGYFDRVYSVSVLEHIPGAGDSDCGREVGRVLAPG